MLVVSGASIIFERRNIVAYQNTFFWSKLILSVPVLILGLLLAHFATIGFGTALLIGSGDINPKLLVLTLAPTAIYTAAVWLFFRWIKRKWLADGVVIILILVMASFVLAFQREWLLSIYS